LRQTKKPGVALSERMMGIRQGNGGLEFFSASSGMTTPLEASSF
jgi:hypothetical protein